MINFKINEEEMSYEGYSLKIKKIFEAVVEDLGIEKSIIYMLDERVADGQESIGMVIRFKKDNQTYGFRYNFTQFSTHFKDEILYVISYFARELKKCNSKKYKPEWIHILD